MDLCHLNIAELAKHLQKCKERVVLRGDNVKDEEGYSAVFTGARCFSVSDGSGNVLGPNPNAPWYGWRNKWRNFNVHSGQNDRTSQIFTIAERRMSRHLDQNSSTTKTKQLESLGKKLRMVTHWRAFFGKETLKRCHLKEMGRYQHVNVFTCTESSDFSFPFMWMIYTRLKRSRTWWTPCGKFCNYHW